MSSIQRRATSSEQRRKINPGARDGGNRPKTSTNQELLKPSRITTGRKLKDREEEFRKLNAELEEKTTLLVKEAEEIMKCTVSPISSPHGANHTSASFESDDLVPKSNDKETVKRKSTKPLKHSDDISLDIERTVRQLEKKLEEEETKQALPAKTTTNVVPEVAEELGSEAMIRFLKAKLRVLQEEHEQLTIEISHKEKELSSAEAKVKDLTEKNLKLEKNQHSIQLQIGKYQKLSLEAQQKCEGLETQLISLKRELEAQKSTHRKASATQSAVEVRLNRALEEVEKYKILYNKLKSDAKDSTKHDKSRIDDLESENKLLERQKTELITAFKKQMKLIDVLKKQKVHLEAARMLAFTEEEFMKVLDLKC